MLIVTVAISFPVVAWAHLHPIHGGGLPDRGASARRPAPALRARGLVLCATRGPQAVRTRIEPERDGCRDAAGVGKL